MQQTISQAAKLYGKARSTIHRAIDAGRLSCSVRGDGVRVIALSELIRLWGEPPNAPPETQQNATPPDDTAQQPQQALLDELRRQTAIIEQMSQRIERLESALRALPAPPRVDEVNTVDTPRHHPEKPQEPRKDDTPADDTVPNWRSLVDALRRQEK